ncbi:hypothetical protein PROFUN_08907 [Planoprotostelium fungivorum]|uniref:Uncharacterized protein n=1 Tax=Planoprotostelium fungivorum TaxID=1890364 RepID=A0A2P6NIU3_9EUKA|nr:hypothetical protein PROFUN_08907 [Planoprotostelium fungivorum]
MYPSQLMPVLSTVHPASRCRTRRLGLYVAVIKQPPRLCIVYIFVPLSAYPSSSILILGRIHEKRSRVAVENSANLGFGGVQLTTTKVGPICQRVFISSQVQELHHPAQQVGFDHLSSVSIDTMEIRSPTHTFTWKRVPSKNCDICNNSLWLSLGYECHKCAIFTHKGCMPKADSACWPRTEIYLMPHSYQSDSNQERERFFKVNGVKKEDHITKLFFSAIDRKLVALNDEGQAFSINVDNFPEELAVVKPMKFLPTRQVKQVTAGADHTLFLTDNGHIYSCGGNQNGQLGVGREVTNSPTPIMISTMINRITDKICAGGHHSLALTLDVFTWGKGENGRLGTGLDEDSYHPQSLRQSFAFPFHWEDSSKAKGSPKTNVNRMAGVTMMMNVDRDLYQTKAIEVQVEGQSYTPSESLRNNHDSLSHSTSLTSQISAVTATLSNEESVERTALNRVVGGSSPPMAMRMMNALRDTLKAHEAPHSPQFNREELPVEKKVRPTEIINYTKPVISSVACGWGHTLVLFRCKKISAKIVDEGETVKARPQASHVSILFTFGKSDFGQCGHGNTEDVKTPKIVKGLENKVVNQVDTTTRLWLQMMDRLFALELARKGNVAQWQTSPLRPVFVGVPSPVRILTCGNFHNIVQTVSGKLYVWGRLFNSSKFVPTEMEKLNGRKIVSIVTGMISSLFVIADSCSDNGQEAPDVEPPEPEPNLGGPISPPTNPLQINTSGLGGIWRKNSTSGSPNSSPKFRVSQEIATDEFWGPSTDLNDTQQLLLHIRKGIPDNHRQKVWLSISGCTESLAQDDKQYERALRAAFTSEEIDSALTPDGDLLWDDLVMKNPHMLSGYLPDGFSPQNHNLSEENQKRMQRLLWVLYKKSRPHFSYLHPILPDMICILLHYISEEQAFYTTRSLFNQTKISDFAHFNIPDLFTAVTLNALHMCAPDLHSHINSFVDDIEQCHFASRWFSRLFVGRFPYRVVLRIFDCFVSEGMVILFRVALAVFVKNAEVLLKCTSLHQITQELENYMSNYKDNDVDILELAWGVSFRRNSCLDYLRRSRDQQLPSEIDSLSSILDHEQLATLWLWLPIRCQLDEPVRIFTTTKHGFNLTSLVNKCSTFTPSVMIMRTKEGHKFGLFHTGTWEKTEKFQGTGETFLFSMSPKMRRYPWTKENNLFFMASNAIMIGGGGSGCSIYLDDELLHGSCNRSATFDNASLTGGGKKDFECVELEHSQLYRSGDVLSRFFYWVRWIFSTEDLELKTLTLPMELFLPSLGVHRFSTMVFPICRKTAASTHSSEPMVGRFTVVNTIMNHRSCIVTPYFVEAQRWQITYLGERSLC